MEDFIDALRAAKTERKLKHLSDGLQAAEAALILRKVNEQMKTGSVGNVEYAEDGTLKVHVNHEHATGDDDDTHFLEVLAVCEKLGIRKMDLLCCQQNVVFSLSDEGHGLEIVSTHVHLGDCWKRAKTWQEQQADSQVFSKLPSELLQQVLIAKAKQERDPALAMVNRAFRDGFLAVCSETLHAQATIKHGPHSAAALRMLNCLDRVQRKHPVHVTLQLSNGGVFTNFLSHAVVQTVQCVNSITVQNVNASNSPGLGSLQRFPCLEKLQLCFAHTCHIENLQLSNLLAGCHQVSELTLSGGQLGHVVMSNFQNLTKLSVSCQHGRGTLTVKNLPKLRQLVVRCTRPATTRLELNALPALADLRCQGVDLRVDVDQVPSLLRAEFRSVRFDNRTLDLAAAQQLLMLTVEDSETRKLCLPTQLQVFGWWNVGFRNTNVEVTATDLRCVTIQSHMEEVLTHLKPKSSLQRLRILDYYTEEETDEFTIGSTIVVGYPRFARPECACHVCRSVNSLLNSGTP